MGGMETNGKGRFAGIERPYTQENVERLQGRFRVEHTIARLGAERLWKLMQTEPYVAALGALTGAQAVQMVKAGLQAIYLSGGRSRRTATSPLTRTRTRASIRRTAPLRS